LYSALVGLIANFSVKMFYISIYAVTFLAPRKWGPLWGHDKCRGKTRSICEVNTVWCNMRKK